LTATKLGAAVAGSLALLVVAVALGLAYGTSGFGGMEVVRQFVDGGLDGRGRTIILEARLPRVVFACCVGAALACSGAVFQAVLRNPLADPYILGISGGAALGGTVLLAVGGGVAGIAGFGAFGEVLGAVSPTTAAFVGALGTLAVIYAVDRWSPAGRPTTYVLLLTGVIVNAFASSVIMFLKSVVVPRKAQELLFYLMGSLSVEGTSEVALVVVAVGIGASSGFLYWFARDLNALSLGDEEAAALGVDVERVRWWTVVASSLAVACSVAFTGLIGFVGLVVPHGVRLLVGPDHRVLLPCCAFGGAAFLVGADLLTRVLFPVFSTALPVGVVTSMVGAPLFMFFLWRNLTRRAGVD
jgi:iron complex transport system permease protein